MSADLSAGMSAGCENDDLPPAPADFHSGLAAYEGMEGLTPMGELESLSTDMGFMGLAAAMPDYSDLEYAAHRMQVRLSMRLVALSSDGRALVNGQGLLPARKGALQACAPKWLPHRTTPLVLKLVLVAQGMCVPAQHLAPGAAGAQGTPEGPQRGGPVSADSTKGVIEAGASVLDDVHALLSYNAGPPPMEFAPEENFTRCVLGAAAEAWRLLVLTAGNTYSLSGTSKTFTLAGQLP